jgi:hypothetical protein
MPKDEKVNPSAPRHKCRGLLRVDPERRFLPPPSKAGLSAVDRVKWYLRPVSVILSLFFVLGPFGLPLLYKSPRFSRTSKIILTIAVVIYTSYLIFILLEIARELYKRIEEFKEILG